MSASQLPVAVSAKNHRAAFYDAKANAAAASRFDAIVTPTKKHSAIAQFYSLQAAINAAPENSKNPFRIFVEKGEYREKIRITKNNLQIFGEDAEQTRIIYSDYAGKLNSSGHLFTTPGSASVSLLASDIRIENITIENSFDFLANELLPEDKHIAASQAVALYLAPPADRVLIRHVRLLSYQDTLFVNSGRSWFDHVLVAGSVDFIFGNGNALFTDSEIKMRARAKGANPAGFITAPSTQISSAYGLTFIRCRLTRDTSVVDGVVPLGRPWHPTSSFPDGRYADPSAVGKSVFIRSWMDAHIATAGWYSMGGIARDGGRISFLPEEARFFEYKNEGPGAVLNANRRQLSEQEINDYTREHIFGDWRPE